MVSYMPRICIVGSLVVLFAIYTEQTTGSSVLTSEPFKVLRRRLDVGHARATIPVFRGSNLGVFLRKRPLSPSEQAPVQRRESDPSASDEENALSDLLTNKEHQQRRFDDYSENPGPMFGR